MVCGGAVSERDGGRREPFPDGSVGTFSVLPAPPTTNTLRSDMQGKGKLSKRQLSYSRLFTS